MASRAAVVLLSLLVAATPSIARAEDEPSGHFTLEAGALGTDEAGALAVRGMLRSEIALRLLGPISAGGFLQVVVPEDPMGGAPPGLGGGVRVTVRPDLPQLGFVPHLELSGARLQLPAPGQLLLDGWSIGLGGGVGATIAPEVGIEARVRHQWWLGATPRSPLSDHAWTFSLALSVDLP